MVVILSTRNPISFKQMFRLVLASHIPLKYSDLVEITTLPKFKWFCKKQITISDPNLLSSLDPYPESAYSYEVRGSERKP